MQTVKTTLLLLICFALLAACGNKGPLYLEDETPVPVPAVEQEPDPSTDETEEEKDSTTKDSE